MTITGVELAHRRAVLSEVNREIRVLAGRLDDHGEWEWPFVCECGDRECFDPVLLPTGLYDDLRQRRAGPLAPGHNGVRARELTALD